MPDKSLALRFEKSAFIAFDLFLLKRPGAEKDYTEQEIVKAKQRLSTMTNEEKETLYTNALLGLPGSKERFTEKQILGALETYKGIDAKKLKDHLFYFLREIIPVAEEAGLEDGNTSRRSALLYSRPSENCKDRTGCKRIIRCCAVACQRPLFLYRFLWCEGG